MNKNRLKIAYMVGTLNQGGLESLVVDVCKQHSSISYDVVCIYRHEGNYSEAFHRTGVRMVKLECDNTISYIYKLRKLLLNEQVYLVHPHTQSNALVCLLALLGTSIPVITTLHGFSFSNVNRIYRNLIYRGCKRLLCVSQYQRKYYQNAWHIPKENKINVIYNGVDFSKIDLAKPSLEFIKQKSRIQFAMVGSFMGGRSQNIIVRSIDMLKQRGITDFDFYFIGRRIDNETQRYDECVQYCMTNGLDNVHFLGGRSDVPSLLKAMDGFVYSREHDTFGIAVVEGMAAGLPVIVNDWAVMKEITHNGKWATLFRTEDIEDCANKMAELLDGLQHNREYVMAQTAQIAQEVRATFSIENHIRQITDLYQEITNNK